MKKIYQYNEILKVHRVLEEIEKFLIGIKDDKYKLKQKNVKRKIYFLRKELEILDLADVIKELKREKRKEFRRMNCQVPLTDIEIYVASRKKDEEDAEFKMFLSDLKRKVLESDVMNE